MGISGPLLLLLMERVSPSRFGPTSLAPFLRLSFGVSAGCGFFYFVRRSSCTDMPPCRPLQAARLPTFDH